MFDHHELSDYLPPPSPLTTSAAEDDPVEEQQGEEINADSSLPSENDGLSSAQEQPGAYARVDATDVNRSVAVNRLAVTVTRQLVDFEGCCDDCHRTSQSEHQERFGQHTSLPQYLDTRSSLCPDILGSTRIASREDDLMGQTNPASRRQIYTGLTADSDDSDALHICLEADERRDAAAGISFDIDSITGFPSSLAIAKQGIRWHPTQMPVSDLKSSLHLRPRKVHFFDGSGRAHSVHRPVHQVSHYAFGRLIGFEDVSLYLLFPRLYREEQQCGRLRNEDFQLWMDGVLFPIIFQQYSSAHVQHYPSSYDHSRYNATARGVETHAQRVDPVARAQQLSSYLPPASLNSVWESIQAAVQQPAFRHFGDVTILLQAKNLKVLTKDFSWELMMSRFENHWARVVDDRYLTPDFYFDIGKEVCPSQRSRVAGSADILGHLNIILRTTYGRLFAGYMRKC